MVVTSVQLPVDEDNARGETITADFRRRYGIGDTGRLPLPPRDHPDALKFARAILSRAHQVKGVDPAKVAARVAKAKSYLASAKSGKESAVTPWC